MYSFNTNELAILIWNFMQYPLMQHSILPKMSYYKLSEAFVILVTRMHLKVLEVKELTSYGF